MVRVNDADSALLADDLRAVFSGQTEPHALMLPKCESIEHLKQVCELKSICYSAKWNRCLIHWEYAGSSVWNVCIF